MRVIVRAFLFPVCLFLGLTAMCITFGMPQQRVAPFVFGFTVEELPSLKKANLDNQKGNKKGLFK